MIRVGFGIDVHPFVADGESRPLVLGGVLFDDRRGLRGHSDSDVVAHACCDALLGAAGLEDIGHHFPDTDERYRDADSLELLRRTIGLLGERGYSVVHVDATVLIERPALAPYRDRVRERLAEALGIGVEHVSVKATRGEGMGFVGRQEGAAALALATVGA